ncbi:uncharacterized protein LOC144909035 [Branchiostoma floridae x Branchiostoma belcheri]
MAAGGNTLPELEAVFDIVQSDLGKDWIRLALKLGLKYNVIEEIRNMREENLMWRNHTVLEKWRRVSGKEATVDKLLTALKRTGRQDLVDRVEEQLCLKSVSSLQLEEEQEVKTSPREQDKEKKESTKESKTHSRGQDKENKESAKEVKSARDQDKENKKSTKPTMKAKKNVKSRQRKTRGPSTVSARLGVRRLEFALNAVQSQQLAKEMRMRCCYIKIEDSVKEELVSGAQHLERKAMEDLSQFYDANKDLSRAAIMKVFKQHKVLRKGLDIAKMWPSSIYVQIFPETDECITALNEYLDSGQLTTDLQTEYEKIGFSGPLQGDVRSMEQLEEEVSEIVEEAMDVFVLSETQETGEDSEESTQTYEELRDAWRDALLRITAWTGDEDKVKTLLQAGVQVNTENSEGETPLWDAVKGGHSSIVRLLLQEGADPGAGASTDSGMGQTCLQLAAEGGNAEVVSILTEAGADLDQADDEGRTALYLAAKEGHVEIVSILSQAGADLNKAAEMGMTPLWVAAERGHAEAVSILTQAGADLNKADDEGFTPLSTAAEMGHVEVVSILTQAGADLDKVDDWERTPLWVAAEKGHVEVVSILIQAGADLNKASNGGHTPLWVAAWNGHVEAVRILTQAGADLGDKANDEGWTPLRVAAGNGHAEVVSILAQAGADLNKADLEGWTPLLVAAERGHVEVMSILAQAGADLDKADKDEQTPLWIAAYNGRMEVVKVLIEAGADIAKPDKTGKTPYQAAIERKHRDVAKVIEEGHKLEYISLPHYSKMAVGGTGIELDAAFNIIQSDLGADWIEFALELGLKFNVIEKIRSRKEENLVWRSRTVLEKWRQGKGKKATLEEILSALERAGRRDLVDSVKALLCHKGLSSLQLDEGQEVKTSPREQDKENKESTKTTKKERKKVKFRQRKTRDLSTVSSRLGVKRLEFALNAVQSQQLAKEMRMRCCYIKIEDSVKEGLVSGAQHLERKAMEDLSQFYNANKDLSRAAIMKVFKQHKVLRKGLDIAKMWPSSIYVQIFPETDECIKALNEYLESGQLTADLQTEYKKIGFSGPLQGDVRSMEQLEEEVSEIVEEAMDVFVLSEMQETGEDSEESTQTYDELRDTWRDALLKITAWTGDEDKVKTLLQAGVQVNTENSEGETPLWDAVRGGHSNIVRLLLQKGADPGAGANTASGTEKTSLWLAAERGHVEVVSILAQAGADLNMADDEGRTPLLVATEKGHAEVMSILIQAGADLDKADRVGRTPLWRAAGSGHVEVVSILSQAGADLDKADKHQQTPLWAAAFFGNMEVVKVLIEAGADISKPDETGKTPYQVAIERKHIDVAQVIEGGQS